MSFQKIDYAQLFDLTVDFAFKSFFGSRDTKKLISLLNAIFARKAIPRVITRLTISSPETRKTDKDDKLSILDIRAILTDNTQLCIEMHMYNLSEFKLKSIRNWARIYGEYLNAGDSYLEQKPAICVSFIDGAINDVNGASLDKIHSLFYISERDDHNVLTHDLELHYINMKAFVKALLEDNCNGVLSNKDGFTKWLTLITLNKISDKSILEKVCGEDAEMEQAVEDLVKISQKKINRQAYQKRLDELRAYNAMVQKIAEQGTVIAEQGTVIAEQGTVIAEQNVQLNDMKAQIVALQEKNAKLLAQKKQNK